MVIWPRSDAILMPKNSIVTNHAQQFVCVHCLPSCAMLFHTDIGILVLNRCNVCANVEALMEPKQSEGAVLMTAEGIIRSKRGEELGNNSEDKKSEAKRQERRQKREERR